MAFANDARAEGRAEERTDVARNALMSIDDVVDITGLTREEVEALSKSE